MPDDSTAQPPPEPRKCEYRLDEQGHIVGDVSCVRCGYNLRGLKPDVVCPECALPVERSLHGDLLRYCDPAWVGQLAKGMRWLVRGVNCILAFLLVGFALGIAFVLAAFIGMLIGVNLAAIGSPGASKGVLVLSIVAMVVSFSTFGLLLSGAVAGLFGHWWLTAPDPARPDEERDPMVRSVGRWGLIGALSLAILGASMASICDMVSTILLLSAEAVLIVGCAAFLGYLAKLSLRLPEMDLNSDTLSVRRTLVGVLALHLGLTMLTRVLAIVRPGTLPPAAAPAAPGSGGPTVGSFVTCANASVVVALWVVLWLLLRLLKRYRGTLHQAWEEAKSKHPAAIPAAGHVGDGCARTIG
jgi:hypothetical protein